MRSPGTRRVALAAGVATVAAIALAGCSAGQVAETAILKPPISGLNTQTEDGTLLVRNLQVVYNNPKGYPAGGSAPLQVSLVNTTKQALTVVIGSEPREGSVAAQQIGLTGGSAAASPSAAPEPSGSRPTVDPVPSESEVIDPSDQPSVPSTSAAASVPAQPAVQPARITIPPLSTATYNPGQGAGLVAVGLSEELRPGNSLSVVVQSSGSAQPLTLQAPVEIPMSPASRAPGVAENENLGETHD